MEILQGRPIWLPYQRGKEEGVLLVRSKFSIEKGSFAHKKIQISRKIGSGYEREEAAAAEEEKGT